jgi:hypothetical protein
MNRVERHPARRIEPRQLDAEFRGKAAVDAGRPQGLSLPSRPGEFHPEPLTDPDLTLSRHPARAIA